MDSPRAGASSPDDLAALIENANDAIISGNLDGIISTWNSAAQHMFGYTRQEMIGRPVSILYPPARYKEDIAYLERVRRGERIPPYETVRLTKDGRLLDISLTLSPIRDQAGEIVGVSAIYHEFSRLVRDQRALAESEARLRAIIDNTDDAIVSKSLEGIVTSWNPGAQRMFGYAPDEIIGRNISMLFPPDRFNEENGIVERLRRGERVHHYETVRIAKDGTSVHVLLSISPLKDAAGRIIGATKIIHDMTENHRAMEALQDSEERFRTIAQFIPQLMWTTSPEGVAGFINARFTEYTGLTVEQMAGEGTRRVMHPEDADPVYELWHNCLKTGEIISTECRYRRVTDGAYRWFLIRGAPVRDADGKILQWIGTCTDIDDHKRAADLEAARLQAEAANKAKSTFLANMSHEIRTPMTAILGYADMLLDTDQTNSDRYNAVHVIRRNGAHLMALINDILDISKIEAGELKVERIAVAPCQILAEVTSMMRVRAREAGLQFDLKIDGQIPAVINTDPTRLRQILINLTGNAIKFTEAGWVRLVARLLDAPDHTNPRMQFQIIDSGIGMNAEQIARLFQPFTQADATTTRRFGGTGLGLTISQRLAHALGGQITVDSQPGRGSLFAVEVETGPLAGVALLNDCAEAFQSVEKPPVLVPLGIGLQGHILLADDGVDNQTLIRAYLRKAGAQVTIADNGRIACDLVTATMRSPEKTPFDLILLDMQMPEMDGYTAATQLRRMGYSSPIIALTANAMSTDRARCLAAGCSDYLSKPIHRDTLLKTIAAHLSASALAHPAADARTREDDEVLAAITPQFVAHLPRDVSQLFVLLREGRLEELKKLCHQLKGTAGMFKFAAISEAAGVLERELARHKPGDQAMGDLIGALVALMRQVPGYDRKTEIG